MPESSVLWLQKQLKIILFTSKLCKRMFYTIATILSDKYKLIDIKIIRDNLLVKLLTLLVVHFFPFSSLFGLQRSALLMTRGDPAVAQRLRSVNAPRVRMTPVNGRLDE